MQKNGKRRTMRQRIAAIAVAVAVLVVCFAAGAVWSRKSAATEITSDLLSQRLTAVSELATVEYRYTNMGKFENVVDFYGWKVPLTRKSFIVSYDGVIKAGIDAAALQVQVLGKRISVKMPPAEILSHEIADDSIQIFDETKNIFNQLQISDYTGFTADQKSAIQQKATEKGLLTEAAAKAKTAVKQLLRLSPGMEEYEIVVT